MAENANIAASRAIRASIGQLLAIRQAKAIRAEQEMARKLRQQEFDATRGQQEQERKDKEQAQKEARFKSNLSTAQQLSKGYVQGPAPAPAGPPTGPQFSSGATSPTPPLPQEASLSDLMASLDQGQVPSNLIPRPAPSPAAPAAPKPTKPTSYKVTLLGKNGERVMGNMVPGQGFTDLTGQFQIPPNNIASIPGAGGYWRIEDRAAPEPSPEDIFGAPTTAPSPSLGERVGGLFNGGGGAQVQPPTKKWKVVNGRLVPDTGP